MARGNVTAGAATALAALESEYALVDRAIAEQIGGDNGDARS